MRGCRSALAYGRNTPQPIRRGRRGGDSFKAMTTATRHGVRFPPRRNPPTPYRVAVVIALKRALNTRFSVLLGTFLSLSVNFLSKYPNILSSRKSQTCRKSANLLHFHMLLACWKNLTNDHDVCVVVPHIAPVCVGAKRAFLPPDGTHGESAIT